MVDLSEFLPVQVCRVEKILKSLGKEKAERLVAALAHEKVSTHRIVEVLRSADWGSHKIGREAVGSHRDGKCACAR